MILRLANDTLTRYMTRSGYASAEVIPLEGAVKSIAMGLIGWLSARLMANETLSDVMLEDAGQAASAHETAADAEGNNVEVPTAFRRVISAAVSVMSLLGSRTFVASSEQLPAEQRDQLLTVWEELSNG